LVPESEFGPQSVWGELIVAVRNLASALAGVFALGAFPRALFPASPKSGNGRRRARGSTVNGCDRHR
jgi:hypothetical protein